MEIQIVLFLLDIALVHIYDFARSLNIVNYNSLLTEASVIELKQEHKPSHILILLSLDFDHVADMASHQVIFNFGDDFVQNLGIGL